MNKNSKFTVVHHKRANDFRTENDKIDNFNKLVFQTLSHQNTQQYSIEVKDKIKQNYDESSESNQSNFKNKWYVAYMFNFYFKHITLLKFAEIMSIVFRGDEFRSIYLR